MKTNINNQLNKTGGIKMVTDKQIEEIRKEIPKDLQERYVKVQNSFKDEEGLHIDFTELDLILFEIIQFYRKE